MKRNPKILAALWEEYHRTRSDEARNKLVEINMPLVADTAKRLRERLTENVDVDDLIQWGAVGLMYAVGKFDATKNVQFSTFANWRIRGEMLDGLRNTCLYPRKTLERNRMLENAEAALYGETGRPPTHKSLRERLGASPKEFARMNADRLHKTHSLETRDPRHQDENRTETDCEALRVEPDTDSRMDAGTVIQLMLNSCEFKLREALQIRLYYLDGLSMKEIAEALGNVSESCISIRHRDILKRLRYRMSSAA